MNLYAVRNTHSGVAFFVASHDASGARNYAAQDVGWEYWVQADPVLLLEHIDGLEGKLTTEEALELLGESYASR